MADEQPKQDNSGAGSDKQKTGKRRYFRRRRTKGKKPDQQRPAQQGTSEAASAPAKSEKRKGAPQSDRQGGGNTGSTGTSGNKKRRSRRRRTSRRSGQQPEVTQRIQEPETPYEEPTSVYVYTHVLRPDYRDSMSDYRPEMSYFSGESHQESAVPAVTLTSDILDQLDHFFAVQEQGGEPPRRIEYNEADWADDDDDWDGSTEQSDEVSSD